MLRREFPKWWLVRAVHGQHVLLGGHCDSVHGVPCWVRVASRLDRIVRVSAHHHVSNLYQYVWYVVRQQRLLCHANVSVPKRPCLLVVYV